MRRHGLWRAQVARAGPVLARHSFRGVVFFVTRARLLQTNRGAAQGDGATTAAFVPGMISKY
jgi:hypothetical protein